MYEDSSLLLTGGTGTFSKAFIKELLKTNIKKIKVYSRCEFKQAQMKSQFNDARLRYYIGDVRDESRLMRAMENVDYVIHTAALKRIEACEADPLEAVKTNINGAVNVINCALNHKVKKVVALSTDKACCPTTLYGATKLVSDKLFVDANIYSTGNPIFSVVRYGNVFGSRGSIVPKIIEMLENNKIINITDTNMTRFSIDMKDAIKMVDIALKTSKGGEIYVPKINSYEISDLLKAFDIQKINIIGKQANEKLNEQMIDENDLVIDREDYYIIIPSNSWYKTEEHILTGFKYTSDMNKFIRVDELKQKIEGYKNEKNNYNI